MAAIIGNNVKSVLPSILIDNELFDIDVANYNSNVQVVISGPESSILAAQPIVEQNSLKFIRLPVSGAFHSRLMQKARIDFSEYLMDFDFAEPRLDVISAMNGEKISADFILEELSFQLERPVRWYETISMMHQRAPNAQFKEFGPGETLTRLNKYIIE